MADYTRHSSPGGENVPSYAKGKDSAGDDDSCDSDTSGSCSSVEYDPPSQGDFLAEGLNTVAPSILQERGSLAPETDLYVRTEYRTLCDAIEEWVHDAFAVINLNGDEPWARLSFLLNEGNYGKKYSSQLVRQLYLSFAQKINETGAVPKAYVAHWIMFNINQDIFDEAYPVGLQSWRGHLDVLTKSIKETTGCRSNFRYIHWLSETMFALTSTPSEHTTQTLHRRMREICSQHLGYLQSFFKYDEDSQMKLEKQYRVEIVSRAISLHRFMKCSVFGYQLRSIHPPEKFKPEYEGKMRFKHEDTLAVVAPILVESIHRLPLYPGLFRLRWETKTRSLEQLRPLEVPSLIVEQKQPSN